MFKQNIGNLDKNIRLIFGALTIIIGTALLNSPWIAFAGIVIMSTGIMRFCALYAVLGINTACKMEKQEDKSV